MSFVCSTMTTPFRSLLAIAKSRRTAWNRTNFVKSKTSWANWGNAYLTSLHWHNWRGLDFARLKEPACKVCCHRVESKMLWPILWRGVQKLLLVSIFFIFKHFSRRDWPICRVSNAPMPNLWCNYALLLMLALYSRIRGTSDKFCVSFCLHNWQSALTAQFLHILYSFCSCQVCEWKCDYFFKVTSATHSCLYLVWHCEYCNMLLGWLE